MNERKEFKMSAIRAMLIVASIAMISTGCASVKPEAREPAVVTNTVVVTQTAVVTNTVVVPKIVEVPKPVPVTNVVVQTRTVTNYVDRVVDRPVTNIIVKLGEPTPPAPLPKALALSVVGGATEGAKGELLAALRAELAKRGYVFKTPGTARASVTVTLATVVKANLDEWHVYEGHASAKVEIGCAPPVVREKRFEAVGERKLGRGEAEKAVVKPLCGSISAWIEKVLKERK